MFKGSNLLMHYVKVILILLSKNMFYQKIYILIFDIVVDDEVPQTPSQTIKWIEVIQEVVLPEVPQLNDPVIDKK